MNILCWLIQFWLYCSILLAIQFQKHCYSSSVKKNKYFDLSKLIVVIKGMLKGPFSFPDREREKKKPTEKNTSFPIQPHLHKPLPTSGNHRAAHSLGFSPRPILGWSPQTGRNGHESRCATQKMLFFFTFLPLKQCFCLPLSITYIKQV